MKKHSFRIGLGESHYRHYSRIVNIVDILYFATPMNSKPQKLIPGIFLRVEIANSGHRIGGLEFSNYGIKLRNLVTQNDATLRVTYSRIFVEILLSS